MNDKYATIINQPHHTSKNRPRMTMYQRAAQFAPFAALTGHGAAINETARLTDPREELTDSACALLNLKINHLRAHIEEQPTVSVSYFVPDERKEGGHYTTHTGTVTRWYEYEQTIAFADGICVRVSDIIDIRGALFDALTF